MLGGPARNTAKPTQKDAGLATCGLDETVAGSLRMGTLPSVDTRSAVVDCGLPVVPAATPSRSAWLSSAVTCAMTSTPGAVRSSFIRLLSPCLGPRDEKPAMTGAAAVPLARRVSAVSAAARSGASTRSALTAPVRSTRVKTCGMEAVSPALVTQSEAKASASCHQEMRSSSSPSPPGRPSRP